MFEYRATVTAVYDADTITVSVDLGFRCWLKKIKIRLYGIDAPEMRGVERPEGIVSRDWLRERILNKQVVLKTYKDKTGKYGRWLARIYIDEGAIRKCINEELVELGLAEVAVY
jgi:micrococcal nuclease